MTIDLDCFKRACQRAAKARKIPLNAAQEEMATAFGFRNFSSAITALDRAQRQAANAPNALTTGAAGTGGTDGCVSIVETATAVGGKTLMPFVALFRSLPLRCTPTMTGDASSIMALIEATMPQVEGEGRTWQEKGLRLARAVVSAACHQRDTQRGPLTTARLAAMLSKLSEVEALYLEGYRLAKVGFDNGRWPAAYRGVQMYLDSGLPVYRPDKLLALNGLEVMSAPAKSLEQDVISSEQHGYRVMQLTPFLGLLDIISQQ